MISKDIPLKGLIFKSHLIRGIDINFKQKKTTIFMDSYLENPQSEITTDTILQFDEILQTDDFYEYLVNNVEMFSDGVITTIGEI